MGHRIRSILLAATLALVLASHAAVAAAEDIGTFAFQQTWARTDQPVADSQADRTWMWGPATSPLLAEPYAEGHAATAGARWVQYFDKARMEITDPAADPESAWYVTNGLLAKELITGQMQVGADQFIPEEPAEINIAGDPDDPNAPTYATFKALLGYAPIPLGWRITQTLDRAGTVGNDAGLARFGVTAAIMVEATHHTVASVFWDFMNGSGRVFDGWQTTDARLFDNPFFATGYPISEAYWTTVKVGGVPRQVLVQAFERRVLTYTPENPDGWKVEAGNVGRHYYEWRYLAGGENPLRVQSVSHRKDGLGNWVFIGDLRNEARAAYEAVKVTVNLYDERDQVVDSHAAFLDVNLAAPGATLPFRVWFDAGEPFARAEVLVEGRPSARMAPARLTVREEETPTAPGGPFTVRGTIRNDEDRPLKWVSYVLALYDRSGRLVGYDWGFADPAVLAPGATATFTARVYHRSGTVASYKVFASGM